MQRTVQPEGWAAALPRSAWDTFPCVTIPGQDWYQIHQVHPGIFALYEPGHFQEVISFLITGTHKALLWDTGMGIAPIRPVVEALTPLPLTVVNSHLHFDHVGGNWEFPQVWGYPANQVQERADQGYDPTFLMPMLAGDALAQPTPAAFDLTDYRIPPWQYRPLETIAQKPLLEQDQLEDLATGQAFALGGRTLQVLHTPGHSKDSIMLWEREEGLLFTGDTLYPAALYAHFDDLAYGSSRLHDYAHIMNVLSDSSSRLQQLFCSHNLPQADPDLLLRAWALFQKAFSEGPSLTADEEGLLRLEDGELALILRQSDL